MASDASSAALDLLHAVTTDDGILASPTDVTNYRRVWARDSVMCGLAGTLAGDDAVTRGLRRTLEVLAETQGPDGQIASNVALRDGEPTDVSYGGLSGRVDAISWFVVGVAHYVDATGDDAFGRTMRPVVEEGLALLTAWEYNRRGLVYVPLGGDWADEYVLHGYVLFDQLMRLWALRCAGWMYDDTLARRAAVVERRLQTTFWPRADDDAEDAYHPHAYRRYVDALQDEAVGHATAPHWLAALAPSGYQTMFDGWSHALSVLLELGSPAQQSTVLDYGETLRADRPGRLLPAFWPPIVEGDPEWHALTANVRDHFSNRPGHYHNGGLWPMVNGWWGCALAADTRADAAADVLDAIDAANRASEADDADDGTWSFPEYRDAFEGKPFGTIPLAWSAAGRVLLAESLRGHSLFFGGS